MEASSGDEALGLVSGFSPDVILLDMMMPGLDGLGTFELLRQKSNMQATPIIFMTAKVQPEEVERYITLGAAGVIIKPFDPITLASEIQGILKQAV
ncbi:MAG: Transcriptional regulatory protein BaeR [bacterium ADurb.Bin425]|nr:MAG: Transcriptional regulatory protein BaeR [bacterium ADurb.Bin425]